MHESGQFHTFTKKYQTVVRLTLAQRSTNCLRTRLRQAQQVCKNVCHHLLIHEAMLLVLQGAGDGGEDEDLQRGLGGGGSCRGS